MTLDKGNDFDVVVVGGGIVGLGTARQLKIDRPNARICVLERHGKVASEQSSHSSGCIHAGLQYKPGSHMARVCVEGNAMMYDYCKKKNIPVLKTGKLTIARNEKQREVLKGLYENAKKNGVPNLYYTEVKDEILKLEPSITNSVAVLSSPSSGTVQFADVARSFKKDFLSSSGTALISGFEAQALVSNGVTAMSNRLGRFRKWKMSKMLKNEISPTPNKITVVGSEYGQVTPFESVTGSQVLMALGMGMDHFAPSPSACRSVSKDVINAANSKIEAIKTKIGYSGLPFQYRTWNNVVVPLIGHYLEVKDEAITKLRKEGKIDLTGHIYPTLNPGDFFSVGTHLTPILNRGSWQKRGEWALPRRGHDNLSDTPGIIIGPLGGLNVDVMAGKETHQTPSVGLEKLKNTVVGMIKQSARDKGFRKLALLHPIICFQQLLVTPQSIFEQAAQLAPCLEANMLKHSYSGNMAQTFDCNTGRTLSDFELALDPRFIKTGCDVLHVLNAPSPAATCGLSLGKELAAILNIIRQ